jgi:hypothetical protein
VADTLADYIAALATHIAHERGWSHREATAWVRLRLEEARREYRALGAPLGDTEEGFVAWLRPRHRPPTA